MTAQIDNKKIPEGAIMPLYGMIWRIKVKPWNYISEKPPDKLTDMDMIDFFEKKNY